jgi:hypothetical protein
MRAVMPFCVTATVEMNRDLSHQTLRSHARGRSLHAPPLTVADLYGVCGQANEDVRNTRLLSEFAVVWLGDPPDGATETRALDFTQADAAGASVVLFVHDAGGGTVGCVLWVDGCIASSASDETLRAANMQMQVREGGLAPPLDPANATAATGVQGGPRPP